MSDQIDVNQLSNALQTKVDLPAGKNQSDVDYVIESQLPTSDNNYTWSRLYKSGWVEQGGFSSGSGNKTITIPVEMVDSSYKPTVSRISGASTTTNVNIWAREPTSSTQFIIYTSADTGVIWEVRGMSAQGVIS